MGSSFQTYMHTITFANLNLHKHETKNRVCKITDAKSHLRNSICGNYGPAIHITKSDLQDSIYKTKLEQYTLRDHIYKIKFATSHYNIEVATSNLQNSVCDNTFIK